jgi:transcriptional regulator with XRE-family HTH domain
MTNDGEYFGKIIRRRRLMANLTLRQLSLMSGLSASYLGRIEIGVRFPSARTVQKISKPLDFRETELLQLAGFFSDRTPKIAEDSPYQADGRLDPAVRMALSQEPVPVQRAVITILAILKTMTEA